ncbi:MAG: hypothetical protein MJ188_01895 [Treponema sp.]|nr:hypothetical protein [Treponema sp.]
MRKLLKKLVFLMFIAAFFSFSLTAQANDTIDITDEVYQFLEMAQLKNYCERLPNTKPYSKNYIITILNEIQENIENLEDSKIKNHELEVVKFYLSRYENKLGQNWNRLAYRFEETKDNLKVTMEVNNTDELLVSSGVYSDSSLNSTGYEIFHNLNFVGDIGEKLSYRITGFVGLTKMDLQQVGSDYFIGLWWYDDEEWFNHKEKKDEIFDALAAAQADKKRARTINTYRNNSVLPYGYKKKWDGSIYYLSNLTSSGLEGWPFVPAIGLGMYGELRSNLFNDRFTIGLSRVNREWAGMDYNSSLVYNISASPFFAFDAGFKLFDWLSFSTLTGFLEFPNAAYIDSNAWYIRGEKYKVVDSYFFQNAYSIGVFNLDLKYVHADFGSTCVWPKRFELGYVFPLIDRVVYQNSVGDFDNLSLFGDLKGYLPGIGSAWLSVYIDEINSVTPKPFTMTRCMFAYQGGTKVNIPFLPFTTLSFRYTKVEPYCYTHQALRKQPWYDDYVSESYTNNGHSIGYYLEPNSDEFFIRIESRPMTSAVFALQYQMVRHGADYGSGQVPGSSVWSELPTGDRNVYLKYFLHDGAYEWSHIVNFETKYDFNQLKLPFQVSCNVGFLYDSFTRSEGGANKSTPYHKINTDEYPIKKGLVFGLGVKMFAFDLCQ